MKTENMSERLVTMFHETFSLSRPSIIQVLRALEESSSDICLHSKEARYAYFRENTHLGASYIKSMPEYCKGSGLLNDDFTFTPFGRMALACDPLLEHPATQWLMHYHLSAPHGPGPMFWYELVTARFRSGDIFTRAEIIEQIAASYAQAKGKPLSPRSAVSTVASLTMA